VLDDRLVQLVAGGRDPGVDMALVRDVQGDLGLEQVAGGGVDAVLGRRVGVVAAMPRVVVVMTRSRFPLRLLPSLDSQTEHAHSALTPKHRPRADDGYLSSL
jgi:hypothetical protein